MVSMKDPLLNLCRWGLEFVDIQHCASITVKTHLYGYTLVMDWLVTNGVWLHMFMYGCRDIVIYGRVIGYCYMVVVYG